MKLYLALVLILGGASTLAADAQPGAARDRAKAADVEEDEAAAEEGTEEEEEDGEEDEGEKDDKSPPVEKPRTGDVITFKTGRILSSVQVVRESVTGLEVRVLAGSPPLKVPRDQIASIEYDDIDPNRPGQNAAAPGADGPSGVMVAKELSPELSRKLAVPLSPEDITLSGKPIVDTLLQLSSKSGFTLEVSDAARQLDSATLVWKSDPPADATFNSLLQDHVVRDYPELAVVYNFDKIVLTTKADVAQTSGLPAIPAPGTPAPGTPPPGAPAFGTPPPPGLPPAPAL